MIEIGDYLVEARKKKGFSQDYVAEKLNISRQSVSLWECNKTQPTLDNLVGLSKLYEVNIAFFFGQTGIVNAEILEEYSSNDKKIDDAKVEKKFNIFSKTSLILSLSLIILFIVPGLSIVISISSIILAILALKIKKTNIVLVSLVFAIVYSFAGIFVMMNMSDIFQLFRWSEY